MPETNEDQWVALAALQREVARANLNPTDLPLAGRYAGKAAGRLPVSRKERDRVCALLGRRPEQLWERLAHPDELSGKLGWPVPKYRLRADALLQWRASAGWTFERLAAELGTSRRRLGELVYGLAYVGPSLRNRLQGITSLGFDELFIEAAGGVVRSITAATNQPGLSEDEWAAGTLDQPGG